MKCEKCKKDKPSENIQVYNTYMASKPEYSSIFSLATKYELYHIPFPSHICNDCVRERTERDILTVLLAIIFTIILFAICTIYQWMVGLFCFPAFLFIIYWDGKALVASRKYFAGKISKELTEALGKGNELRVLTQEEYDKVKLQTFRGFYEEYTKTKND